MEDQNTTPPTSISPSVFKGPISFPDQATLLEFFKKNVTFKKATGVVHIASTDPSPVSVAHGLGITPDIVTITFFPGGADPQHMTNFHWVSTSTPSDAMNIYIEHYGSIASDIYWTAIKL